MLLATSCAASDCTLVACVTGVSVDLAKGFPVSDLAFDVTICADDVCNTTNIDPTPTNGPTSGPVFVQLAIDDQRERDVAVRVEVRSTTSATVLIAASGTGRLRRNQPNGKGCDPVCYTASFTFDEATNTLTQR
jgi:hypothetical protein